MSFISKINDKLGQVCKKKLVAISISAVAVTAVSVTIARAGFIKTEQPIAGINVALEEFLVAEAGNNTGYNASVTQNISGMNIDKIDAFINEPAFTDIVDGAAGTDVNEPAGTGAGEAGTDDELQEEKDEHVKLNLNYDRLGIAKVDTYLNVRKKPSTSGKIVGKLTKNAGCHIYKIKKGWAKIVSGKVNGWVKASYLVKDKKAEEMALEVGKKVVTVLENGLRARALPSTDSAIYSVLSIDEDFEVCREKMNAEWLEKFIGKHIKKKQLKGIDYDAMVADLSNWVCIHLDNEYAFVAREYVDIAYKLKRAVKVGELKAGTNGVTSTRASIVEYAKQFLGNRYVYGGTSLTNGTDCSGFTMGVFAHYGYGLPRTSGSQAAATKSISSSEVRPGDLFFYGGSGHVNHVALYIGGGMIIHASNPSSGIKISNAYYRQPVKIGRVIRD